MSLSERWSQLLDELRRQGRYRSLSLPAGVDFTSNDYLGYAATRRLRLSSAQETSGTASRLLRGHHELWEQVECKLAHWHNSAAALVLNSGYAANEGLLATIIEPQDWVASDADNHASIIDGLRLSRAERFIFPHRDLQQLESGLQAAAADRVAKRQLFLVTESLFSMAGDRAPLAELAALAAKYDAHLIVDEAHATGCFGHSGSGLVDELGLRNRVLATVHTGGKALGVTGAYVCGSHTLKELLVNRCRHLIFTTALPPFIAEWWLEMLPILQNDETGRATLHENVRRFRSHLSAQGIATSGENYIVPVLLGTDAAATQAAAVLQQQGLDIRAIRPPTVPPGTSRLRISIHADHDWDTLARAAQAVAQVVQQI